MTDPPIDEEQEIAVTRKAGSFTLEESLAALAEAQKLHRRVSTLKAADPDELPLSPGE